MKYFIMLVLSIVCETAYSAPMNEDATICYKFSNDKLVNKSSCIVSSGYGAGGSYTSIEQSGNTYSIETEMCYKAKTDDYEECGTSLNNVEANFYYRDLFYKKISDMSLVSDNSLKCFITKNKKIDICYK
ncbi:hypothetical protein [Acinetobacter sp. ANC 5378]|uniref:hypothetical protein n=1 Tax=Acinetobacter sp. ANC 5378 TaxID=2731249 RepID=UPI00148F7137|nr:hypothetical protein [Acinetobacter sp. ANC 5378]NNG82930.1 hypothetical protein [Acinetobacter sp. ANC 5378]